MKILYFPCTHSAAGFYRCFQPAIELEKKGHECYVTHWDWKGPVAQHYLDEKDLMDADIVVLQMRPEPLWLRLIPHLQSLGKKVVAEADDWYGGLPPWHPARKALADAGLSVTTIHQIYSLCDAVTVSTPFLAEDMRRYNDNVHLLPNFLDWGMWRRRRKRDWERLRIGWTGNALLRPDDISVLRGVLGPFLARHPEVDFVAAGSPQIHDELDVPEGQRVSFELVEYPDLPSIMRFDIGVVPLAMHNFNEAKSNLKGLEMNACGIPYVASPTQPYREWTDKGSNGFLAKRPKDWLRHLELLVTDRDVRDRMGRAARRKARSHSIQRHSFLWEELYASLLGDEYDGLAREAIKRGALQKPTELAGFLRFLGGAEPPRVVVEIGSATGGMFYALAQVAADDALLVSIDLPFGDFQGEDAETFTGKDRYGREDTPVETMRGYLRKGQRAEFLRMDSQDRATRATLERILDGVRADLIFIDGDHSYEGVRRDWELYRDLGEIVAFHDILHHPREPRSQVHRLWAQLVDDRHHAREFVHYGEERGWGTWGGIGVVEMAEEAIAA